MTNLLSLSPKVSAYSSVLWNASSSIPGVRFAVKRMSLGRRIDLLEKLRVTSLKQEFLEAGSEVEQLDAVTSNQLASKLLLEWGLVAIEGLSIDGEHAGTASVIDSGPEELCEEIVILIRSQLGLTEEERKNF